MTVYLDEDDVGHDAHSIAYPHLLLCMGVTVIMGDGSIAGAHISTGDTEKSVLARLKELMALIPATTRQMLLTGNFEIHFGMEDICSPAEKAGEIGYKGKILCFDTSSFKPKDGAFVRVITNGQVNNPTIEFKRNEKVTYATTASSPMGHFSPNRGIGFRVGHTVREGSSINVAAPKDLNVIEV